MTGKEIAEIIGQLAIFVTAIASLIASIRNSRKIEQVHVATNSMKDELVAVTKKASKAEGVSEEKEAQQNREDITAAALAAVTPLDVKITNLPSEPVPTVTADAKSKPGK